MGEELIVSSLGPSIAAITWLPVFTLLVIGWYLRI